MSKKTIFLFLLLVFAQFYPVTIVNADPMELTGTISGDYYNVDDIYTSGECMVAQGSSATLSTWSSVTMNPGFHVVLGGSLTTYVLDTDSDGLLDSWELQYFGNLNHDPDVDDDYDGLTNLWEYQALTNPTNPDTDDDILPDGWEVQYDLDPLDPADARIDSDNDGYLNLWEYNSETDPSDTNDHPSGTPYIFDYDENGNLIDMGEY